MIALKIAIMSDFVAREYGRDSAQKVVGEEGAHKLDQIPASYPQSTERAFSGILHINEPVERIDASELLSLLKTAYIPLATILIRIYSNLAGTGKVRIGVTKESKSFWKNTKTRP